MSHNNLYKQISTEIWNRIEFSNAHGFKYGEVTITENLLFEIYMHRKNTGDTSIQIFESKYENTNGSDLLYFKEITAGYYLPFCIQAKKGKGVSCKYTEITHKIKGSGESQIDILLNYAKSTHSVPLYFLYNFMKGCGLKKCEWYGCSFVSAKYIRNNFFSVTGNTIPDFNALHITKKVAYPLHWLSCKNLYEYFQIEFPYIKLVSKSKAISIFKEVADNQAEFRPRVCIIDSI